MLIPRCNSARGPERPNALSVPGIANPTHGRSGVDIDNGAQITVVCQLALTDIIGRCAALEARVQTGLQAWAYLESRLSHYS